MNTNSARVRIVCSMAVSVAIAAASTAQRTTGSANELWRKAAAAAHGQPNRGVPRELRLSGRLTNADWLPPTRPLSIEFRGTTSFAWTETVGRGVEGFAVEQGESHVLRPGGTVLATGTGHRNFRKRWAQFAIVYLVELPRGCAPELFSLGRRTLNSRPTLGVEVRGPCSARYQTWFDAETSELVAMDAEEVVTTGSVGIPAPGETPPTPGGLEPSSRRVARSTLLPGDFRTVDGLRIPFKLSIADGRTRRTIELMSATVTW